MKTLIVPIHSTVDLITNSSSELFVCNTNKTVEAVKEVLIELAKLYNQRVPLLEKSYSPHTMDLDQLFTIYFKEPRASKWTFNLYDFPLSKMWFGMYEDNTPNYGFSYETKALHPVLAEASEKMKEWNDKNPSPPYPDGKGQKKAAMTRKYNAYSKKRWSAEKVIYAEWGRMELDIYASLFSWAAKLNGVDLTPLGKLKCNPGNYRSIYFDKMSMENRTPKGENCEAAQFINEIENAISWGYNIKKGDVFLQSADDNSIPYEFWPDIEQAFNSVTRIHCG